MSELKDKNEIEEKPEENPKTRVRKYYYDPELAAYARRLGEENRRNRPPFDRAKFEEFLDTDPLLYNMRFRDDTDD